MNPGDRVVPTEACVKEFSASALRDRSGVFIKYSKNGALICVRMDGRKRFTYWAASHWEPSRQLPAENGASDNAA